VQRAPPAGLLQREPGAGNDVSVHSNQLAATTGLGTTEITLYTVPTGKRTIVKSIVLLNTNAAANIVAIEVYNGATLLAFMRFYLAIEATAGDTVNAQTWFVLNAGQTLKGIATKASASVLISGSELDT
jgi:hypothetical protein